MKTLIAYFSQSGNTANVAKKMQDITGDVAGAKMHKGIRFGTVDEAAVNSWLAENG